MELKMVHLLLLIFPVVSLSLANNSFRFELNHIDSKRNFNQIELLNRAAARTMRRLSTLRGRELFSSTNISTTVEGQSEEHPKGEYYMDLAIGTPPLYYSAIVDTGSQLIWTRCAPCENCVVQSTPIYDPSKSTTVSSIPCNSTLYTKLCTSCSCPYNITYGIGWTSGTLKQETFTIGTTQLSNPVLFGCSTSNSDDPNGTSGLVGFSRGMFSLPSQLNTSMFSYCLTSFLDANSKSKLFIGPSAKFSGTFVESTKFVTNPSSSTTSLYYYISLQGISFGTTNLPIQTSAFSLHPNGTGGVIIDSGTTYTYLIKEAYQAVRNAIDSIVELEHVNSSDYIFRLDDLCYNLSSSSSQPTMPNMTFHFDGADMVLPVENYMVQFANQNDIVWCLAMGSSSDSESILGNYQQQNFHILYDVNEEVLSFYPTKCDNL